MLQEIIKAILDNYDDLAKNQPLEYSYGYFDALAVIRRLAEQEKMK